MAISFFFFLKKMNLLFTYCFVYVFVFVKGRERWATVVFLKHLARFVAALFWILSFFHSLRTVHLSDNFSHLQSNKTPHQGTERCVSLKIISQTCNKVDAFDFENFFLILLTLFQLRVSIDQGLK